jgi:curli biogenesis system outer membrane secretion channel CsgG
MKKIICLLALSLIITASAIAAESATGQAGEKPDAAKGLLQAGTKNAVMHEVTGQGRNRDEAIKNALYRAIEQARGVKVGSGTYEFSYRGSSAGFGSQQPGQRSIDLDSMDFSTQGTVYTTEIGGLIKSYEVLDEKQVDPDTYQVKLNVAVYDYAARWQSQRVRVALMPVKTMQNTYQFLNSSISAEMLSTLFSQRLAAGLVQTNKFAVLDRESLRDFAAEKNVLFSLDAPLSEQAKLAETLGADYLLVGTITQASIERIQKNLQAANYTTNEYTARLNFDYRLVDNATKQIVLASNAQKYLKNEDVRNLSDEQDPDKWNAAQIRDAFISIVVNDVIEAIINRVYPITIADVQPDDGVIILNQGGERMAAGMVLDVFKQGREVFDADTGESLGTTENRIATIEIKRVAPTMSYAAIVNGDLSQISKGLVCRIREQKKSKVIKTKSDVIRSETGGVSLPFDKK